MGALNIDRVEAEAIITDGQVQGINTRKKNRASELIENFMVAANGVMARTLMNAGVSSIRRVVKTPERWPRIVELAARYGDKLPPEPDSGALNRFLAEEKSRRPGALRGRLPGGDQADGAGRVCAVAARATKTRGTSRWPRMTTRIPPRPTAASPIR